MEELLRQAFQLGQQWVQDINNDKEPKNFNEWYSSDEVQEQVKNCSIPAVMESVCSCSKGKGIDHDEDGKAYCIDCGNYLEQTVP